MLAYENGDEFLKTFEQAAAGELEPFILVVEGSIPDERNNNEGCWAGFGTDPATGQPITTCHVDRLARSPGLGRGRGRALVRPTAASTPWPGNPTGCMGLPDYLGWDWQSPGGIPIVCVPGCPVPAGQLHGDAALSAAQAAGRAPMIPLDEATAADLAVQPHRPRGLRPRRLL